MSTFTYVKKTYDWDDNLNRRVAGEKTKVKWHSVLLVISATFIATALICLAAYWSYGYQFFKASGSQYRLAKSAPSAALIASYLQDMQAGLDQLNVKTGYHALVFKADSNSIPVYRHNVDALIARAQYVSTLKESDISYQYAITNLHTAVTQLGTIDNAMLWVRYWPILLWGILGLVFGGVAFLWGAIRRSEFRYNY